jgi:dTDP-4-dehydrorhamnose reductase
MRLAITAAAGMLGQDVVGAAQRAGHEVIGFSRADLDITDPVAIDEAIRAARPDVVVNCAAWTDVDAAEQHYADAVAVNAGGAGRVARAAAGCDAWTIQISSDYVFDGVKREPYIESDPTAPLSAYGRSKLAGEVAVADEASEAYTIVRSSWLFGEGGACFPATILRLASERDELKVVDDQIGSPTFTAHLAAALVEIATRRPLGIVHLAGAGSCSWYDFAREIVAQAGITCDVRPCSTTEMPRPATRPTYSVLGTKRDDVPRLPHWRDGLSEYLAATRLVSAA